MTHLDPQKIRSSILMYALGDAWGYVSEFDTYHKIIRQQPPIPKTLVISDDTQMSLYTIEALRTAESWGLDVESIVYDENVADTVRVILADAYLDFFHDPDNYRAPGMTCMGALGAYASIRELAQKEGITLKGDEGNTNDSMGCGTIMRAPWLGFTRYNRETVVALNILHSQTTHGDPVGWVASAVSSLVTRDLTAGAVGDVNIFSHAIRVVDEISAMNFPLINTVSAAAISVRNSLSVYLNSWDRIAVALRPKPDSILTQVDINEVFGEGWIANESLFNALGAFQLYRDREKVMDGMKRLVYSNGDSDSIAAVGGAFFGAAYGVSGETQRAVLSKLEPRYQYEIKQAMSFLEA